MDQLYLVLVVVYWNVVSQSEDPQLLVALRNANSWFLLQPNYIRNSEAIILVSPPDDSETNQSLRTTSLKCYIENFNLGSAGGKCNNALVIFTMNRRRGDSKCAMYLLSHLWT